MKKRIAVLVMILGFLLLTFTALASDADMISLGDVVVCGLISVVMMAGGMFAAWIIEEAEE